MKKCLALKLRRYKGEGKEITISPSQFPFPSLLAEICFAGEGMGFHLVGTLSLVGTRV